MKNSSIRNIDFKSRAGDFSFGPKKRSKKAKIGFISIALVTVIGASTIFFQTDAGAVRSDSLNIASSDTGTTPTVINEKDSNNSDETALQDASDDHIQLSLPMNAKAPSGFRIPLKTSIHNPAYNEADDNSTVNRAKSNITNSKIESSQATTNKSEITKKSNPLTLGKEETYKVKKGDSLSSIFKRAKISAKELMLLTKLKHSKFLREIYPGDALTIQRTSDGKLGHLHKRIDISRTLVIDLKDDKFISDIAVDSLDIRYNRISSIIDSSLYLSAKAAGLSDNVIMDLANIFGWDVDFALDLRKGDSFAIIYEEIFRNGELVKTGNIVAAEFINRGNRFVALRYTDPNGNTSYFTPEGKSMKKAFLRAPVDFRRISSHFKPQRWHPVLGKKRPHRGVDYAASPGTPIKASGDGKIIFRGWKGGYGRTIILKHGTKYTTLFAHMSKFKGGLKTGSRVKQGQTIGYVGSSGLATGPHLHYEFRVNGAHRNPVTIKLPDSDPIARSILKDFKAKTSEILSELNIYAETVVALRDN